MATRLNVEFDNRVRSVSADVGIATETQPICVPTGMEGNYTNRRREIYLYLDCGATVEQAKVGWIIASWRIIVIATNTTGQFSRLLV